MIKHFQVPGEGHFQFLRKTHNYFVSWTASSLFLFLGFSLRFRAASGEAARSAGVEEAFEAIT